MKCLVTGGAGFVGSNLVLELKKEGHEVVTPHIDIAEEEVVDEFDAIFHQAAITDPRYAGVETFSKNIRGFTSMVALAKRCGAKLVYASSAGVYGNGTLPMQEDQEKKPFTPYAESKLKMDERAAELFNSMHIVGLRYFNVFGPRENHKGRAASMIYHLREQMVRGERPRIFKFGEQKRDHVYIKDVVRANILALSTSSDVYNVGTGIATSFNDVAKTLNDVLGGNLEAEYIDNPYEEYQGNTQADTIKAREHLKFEAQWNFKDAVKDYHEFLAKSKGDSQKKKTARIEKQN